MSEYLQCHWDAFDWQQGGGWHGGGCDNPNTCDLREHLKHKVLPSLGLETGRAPDENIWDAFKHAGPCWTGSSRTLRDGSRALTMVGSATASAPEEFVRFRWQFAVKLIQPCDKELLRRTRREIEFLAQLKHQHIVSYMGSCETQTGKAIAIAMYPLGRRSLSDHMSVISAALEASRALSQPVYNDLCAMCNFLACLSHCIKYVHRREQQGIKHKLRLKHKDIKPDNIIIDYFNSPLLTDFGSSTVDTGTPTYDTTDHTKKYAAPEVWLGRKGPGRTLKTDIFSLGCVFMEIVTLLRGYPLRDLETFLKDNTPSNADLYYGKHPKVVQSWINDGLAIVKPPLIDPSTTVDIGPLAQLVAGMSNVLNMISRMLSEQPDIRPDANELWTCF